MGEVVNLRLARKRKARAAHDAEASANRALHGRTRSEKSADETERARRDALLDGHRLAPRKDDDAP